MHLDDDAIAARAVARLARNVERSLAEVDLSCAQYRALGMLTEDTAGAGLLADVVAVSPGSATSLITGLVARGLVERLADPEDGRRQVLSITDAGVDAVVAADKVVAACLRDIADRLTAEGATRPSLLDYSLGAWHGALHHLRVERTAAIKPRPKSSS